MTKALKILKQTQSERIKQALLLLNDKEKTKLLQSFHPDYKAGMKKKLRIGPNKGEQIPKEFIELLEAYSPFSPDNFNLSKTTLKTDVLIIGGGGAGSTAALIASENNAKVLLVTKLRLGDANTIMAQGGIQAADKPNDSPAIHYLDIMGGGHFKNDPELVKALVMDAPNAISWLENLGTMFDKEKDGSMITIHGGGTSKKRMHSCRDYSGGEIMKTLKDEVLNKQIDILEFTSACELLTDDHGKCVGAITLNMETQEYQIVQAKTTIIATGGSGRLHIQKFPTTNHYGATADGLVLAYRAGCKFSFMDTIQYHPTGAAFPEQILGLLITEKVRGLGAHLVNSQGKRFINELEPRDVVAAAIIRECEKGNGIRAPSGILGVWLDSPLIDVLKGENTVNNQLPAMLRQYSRFNIDISKDPILIYPTQHYQNGGIVINDKGETSVENLFVIGEASGGIHGENRLMGNSLADIIVFGIRAGKYAALKAKNIGNNSKLTLNHIARYHRKLRELNINPNKISPILLPNYRRE